MTYSCLVIHSPLSPTQCLLLPHMRLPSRPLLGMRAGKGVIIAQSVEEGYAAVDRMMVQKEFGDAGDWAPRGVRAGPGPAAGAWRCAALCCVVLCIVLHCAALCCVVLCIVSR